MNKTAVIDAACWCRQWKDVAVAWAPQLQGVGAAGYRLRTKYSQLLLAFERHLSAGCPERPLPSSGPGQHCVPTASQSQIIVTYSAQTISLCPRSQKDARQGGGPGAAAARRAPGRGVHSMNILFKDCESLRD